MSKGRQAGMIRLAILAAAAVLLAASPVRAGGGPENVAVVVNGDSWASLTIANEFIRLRQIPPDNVIILHNLPDIEQVTVEDFRSAILGPVLKAMRSPRGTGTTKVNPQSIPTYPKHLVR